MGQLQSDEEASEEVNMAENILGWEIVGCFGDCQVRMDGHLYYAAFQQKRDGQGFGMYNVTRDGRLIFQGRLPTIESLPAMRSC